MDQLEGKYFEKTIAALKQAKNEESINMRPEFRDALRNGLIEKALGFPQTSHFDWADFILRFKYVMAGVPVLAVMTLVAASVYNWQVQLPTQQIIPVAADQKTDSSTDISKTMATSLFTQDRPEIITFSADSVMPPLEVLIEARQRLLNGSQDSQLQVMTTTDQTFSEPTLVESLPEMKLPSLTIESSSVTAPVNSIEPAEQNKDSGIPKFIFNGRDVNLTGWMQNFDRVPQEIIPSRQENNGRVEANGQVNDAIDTQPAKEDQVDLALPSLQMEQSLLAPKQAEPDFKVDATFIEKAPNNMLIEDGSVKEEIDTQNQLMLTQPAMLKLDESLLSIDGKGDLTEESYINVLEEKKNIGMDVNLKLQNDGMVLLPMYLDDARIYFEGEEREEVLVAVKKGLYPKNGNLSNDYYVKVKRLDNGNYKAVLFEYGQIQQILILGERGGQLEVITEIHY